MTINVEVERYMEGAKSVVESDPCFKEDNPDMTVKEYALESVESDIEYARLTRQWEWVKELRQIKRIIQRQNVKEARE